MVDYFLVKSCMGLNCEYDMRVFLGHGKDGIFQWMVWSFVSRWFWKYQVSASVITLGNRCEFHERWVVISSLYNFRSFVKIHRNLSHTQSYSWNYLNCFWITLKFFSYILNSLSDRVASPTLVTLTSVIAVLGCPLLSNFINLLCHSNMFYFSIAFLANTTGKNCCVSICQFSL